MNKNEIWKYQIPAIPGRHKIDMVEDAEIVSIQPQNQKIALWVIVNPLMKDIRTIEKNRYRTFHVVMTGEEFEERKDAHFLGTCQFENGFFILHVFELTRE